MKLSPCRRREALRVRPAYVCGHDSPLVPLEDFVCQKIFRGKKTLMITFALSDKLCKRFSSCIETNLTRVSCFFFQAQAELLEQ